MMIEFIREFSLPERRRVYSIINTIAKNVNEKKWSCLIDECKESAINSHVLQKNNVLSTIAKNNHVYVLSNEIGADEKNMGKTKLEKVGINRALVYPLFCKTHDLELFKKIEISNFNPFGLEEQLLFTYRALCCEVHKKRNGIEYYQRILNSHVLDLYIFKEDAHIGKQSFSLGLQDCEYYKTELEYQLRNISEKRFHFETLEYPLIKLSSSAIFSPLSSSDHPTDFSPFKNIFFSSIPYKNNLFIILGYHKTHVNKWMENYIDEWKNLNKMQLELKLSDLVASRTEAFCLSPETIEKMSPSIKASFLEYWDSNGYNLSEQQNFPHNIF